MDLTPPDSDVAAAAAALAAEVSPDFILNHVHRTYWYGRTLVRTEIDVEAAYVASMLHDLGLTDAFRGEASFEVVTADHAAHFLEERGWDAERIGLVTRAITRHTNITPNEDPVELVVQGGAAFDVIGFPPDSIPAEVVDAVEAAFPRNGFKQNMLAAFRDEVAAQPEGAFAQLEQNLTFSKLAEARIDPTRS
jgi:hypothetical protein